MRILAVQPGWDVSVQDVHNGWVEALRGLGQQVVDWNLNDRLVFYDRAFLRDDESPAATDVGTFRKALDNMQAVELAVDGLYSTLYRLHPDVLLVCNGTFVPVELLDLARYRGTTVVLVHTESPYEDARQAHLAPHADWNLLNDPTNLADFQQISRAYYQPHSYRPLHSPGRRIPRLASDLAFVGSGFPSRIELLEAMDLTGIDLALGGNWRATAEDSPLRKALVHDINQMLDNDQTVRLYRSAKVGLNYYRRLDGEPQEGWAMGPREVEMAAVGLPFVRDPRPEGDEVLSMLPVFHDPAEATEAVRWLLAHPRKRADIARRAREAVADRTFHRTAATLLHHLEEG